MPKLCEDLKKLEVGPPPTTPEGCEDCLKTNDEWVHLRLCLTCGHVGCCDNSKNKHARKHAKAEGHPVIRSFEPDETWRYCFVHDIGVEE